MYNNFFCENIIRIMQERGLQQNGLAAKAGISQSFVSEIIRGGANPSLDTMEAISNAINVPLPFLLMDPDIMDWLNKIFAQQQKKSQGLRDGPERQQLKKPRKKGETQRPEKTI